MIPIFDLDDTLYPERTFVESGFRAVADWLGHRFGWDAEENQRVMLKTLDQQGRGAVFNSLLACRGADSKLLVRECVRIYRHHVPAIALSPTTEGILCSLKPPLYLVTDGHKIVQQNKIRALGLETRFKKVFITHRYGIRHAKPSIHCFEIIRRTENCELSDMAYIGDNPNKDFVNLTPLGVRTIRVLTGEHRDVKAKPGFEAAHVIASLNELPPLLEKEIV